MGKDTYLSVNNGLGKVELADHAKRNGSSARLGIVELALEHNGVDVLLLDEDLGIHAQRSSPTTATLYFHAEKRRYHQSW
jgi:hypothetical protein